MKNLITITSILAAGTLCANAANTLDDTVATIDGKTYVVEWTFQNSPGTVNASTGYKTLLNSTTLTQSWAATFSLGSNIAEGDETYYPILGTGNAGYKFYYNGDAGTISVALNSTDADD